MYKSRIFDPDLTIILYIYAFCVKLFILSHYNNLQFNLCLFCLFYLTKSLKINTLIKCYFRFLYTIIGIFFVSLQCLKRIGQRSICCIPTNVVQTLNIYNYVYQEGQPQEFSCQAQV